MHEDKCLSTAIRNTATHLVGDDTDARDRRICVVLIQRALSRWLLIDGVAMLIRDDLVRSGMSMRGAAMMTRAFWPEWTIALARIEHRDEPWLFTAAELSDGKWWCAF